MNRQTQVSHIYILIFEFSSSVTYKYNIIYSKYMHHTHTHTHTHTIYIYIYIYKQDLIEEIWSISWNTDAYEHYIPTKRQQHFFYNHTIHLMSWDILANFNEYNFSSHIVCNHLQAPYIHFITFIFFISFIIIFILLSPFLVNIFFDSYNHFAHSASKFKEIAKRIKMNLNDFIEICISRYFY